MAFRSLLVRSNPTLPPARTRREAISDLPEPAPGPDEEVSGYGTVPHSDFHHEMRAKNDSHRLHGHCIPRNKQMSLFDGQCDADMDQPADTIPCKYSIDWKCCFAEKGRLFTTRESARFQTWPDRFSVGMDAVAQQRNLGNMVPPQMAKAIGQAIMKSRE